MLSKNTLISLEYICWQASLGDAHFPTLRLRRGATSCHGCELPVRCSLYATYLLFPMIINIQYEKPVAGGPPVSSPQKKQKNKANVRSSQRVFEVRCWTACVNQNAVITGEGMSSWTLTGCGFEWGGERETDGNDEKAEKITHQDEKRWRYKGFKVKGG